MAQPSLARVAGYAALVVLAIISLLPVWVALKTALTLPNDFFSSASSLVPPTFTLQNFGRVLGFETDIVLTSAQAAPINFALALRNSVIYAGLLVTGQLFFSALAAYAFARLRFPGRDVLFVAFLSATMIPSIVLFIPNFVLIRELGLINTFAGMVAPNILMVPFAVFFLRQFFISSPKELEEAARLEGLSHFQIFWHIALPLQRGPMATLAILLSINAWNDFFWPFLVGREDSVRPLAVALPGLRLEFGQGQPDWTGLMAAVMLSIIPILFLLAFFGRRIVESLQTSGMK
jgi:multiple sugar transport system permease protein